MATIDSTLSLMMWNSGNAPGGERSCDPGCLGFGHTKDLFLHGTIFFTSTIHYDVCLQALCITYTVHKSNTLKTTDRTILFVGYGGITEAWLVCFVCSKSSLESYSCKKVCRQSHRFSLNLPLGVKWRWRKWLIEEEVVETWQKEKFWRKTFISIKSVYIF